MSGSTIFALDVEGRTAYDVALRTAEKQRKHLEDVERNAGPHLGFVKAFYALSGPSSLHEDIRRRTLLIESDFPDLGGRTPEDFLREMNKEARRVLSREKLDYKIKRIIEQRHEFRKRVSAQEDESMAELGQKPKSSPPKQ
jgi:hypothetical protein